MFNSTKTVLGAIIAGVVLLGGLILALMSLTTVDQGHRGVIYSRSTGVQDKTLGQGWHFVSPLERVTEYPVSTTTVKYNELSLATKDGKPLSVDITYDYFNDTELLPKIYDKFKGAKPSDIEDSWLKSRLTESALSVTSKYTILDVFQKREAIRTEIQQKFREDVKDYGFIIENVVFGTPVPDEATKNAIQNVVNRQQELEALKVEKQKAEIEAEKLKIKVQGEAEATLIKAKGQAEANRIINESLTPQLIQLKQIEKWDGDKNVTTKVVGSDANVIVGGSK